MKINVSTNELSSVPAGGLPFGTVVKVPAFGDTNFYMVCRPYNTPVGSNRTHPNYGAQLVNLATGHKSYIARHAGVIVFPHASMTPGAPQFGVPQS